MSLSRRSAAFTLLELLSVIAVIGVLAAMLFPAVRSARVAAHRAKTKVLFSQWAAAVEAFRGEYGYYPAFDVTALVNAGSSATAGDEHLFHDILAGRRRDGSPLVTTSAAARQNPKQIAFHTFTASDLTPLNSPLPNFVRDAFDNTEIAVLVDRNLDGMIDGADYPLGIPAVSGARPGATDFPATGVRAGVVFYAPDPGADPANPDFIWSWK